MKSLRVTRRPWGAFDMWMKRTYPHIPFERLRTPLVRRTWLQIEPFDRVHRRTYRAAAGASVSVVVAPCQH